MAQREYNSEFNSIVKESIYPHLKELGFKKKGNNFFRDLGEFGQAFNIQQSRWNTKHDKSFVFNLGLIDKPIYEETRNLELPSFPQEVDCNIRLRLSNINAKINGWHKLNSQVDLSKLKKDITEEIQLYVVPFFHEYKDPNKWVEFLNFKKANIYNPIDEFLLIEKFLGIKQAEMFINELYNNALIPRVPDNEMSKSNIKTMRETEKRWVNQIVNIAKKKGIDLRIINTTNESANSKNIKKDKNKPNFFNDLKYYLKSLLS